MRCPECDAPLPDTPTGACPSCGLPLLGPVAQELWQIDQALADLRTRQARLTTRREELLTALRRARSTPETGEPAPETGEPAPEVPAAAAAGQPEPGGGVGEAPAWPGTAERPREVSTGAVRNLLLILGGLLLTVAAVVFTVVSWGRMGIGGRTAVLAGFTALALAVPALLVRRRLTATAETVAAFAVALLILDGYAARQVGLFGVDLLESQHYTAWTCAIIAIILVVYARFVPLRGPAPVAVVLAQPVLILPPYEAIWLVTAVVATVALDVALVWAIHGGLKVAKAGSRGVAVTAIICGTGAAAFALLLGTLYAFDTLAVPDVLARSAPLAGLALIGGVVTARLAGSDRRDVRIGAGFTAAGTALTLIIVLSACLRPWLWSLGPDWPLPGYTFAALAVALAATRLPWTEARQAAAITGGTVALLTVLPVLPQIIVTLAEPLAWFGTLGTGTWGTGILSIGPIAVTPQITLTLALLATGSWLITRNTSRSPANTNQPPESGEQPPESGEQPPGSGGQVPGSGGQVPGSGGQVPGSGGRSSGSGGQVPGGGGRSSGSGGQALGNGEVVAGTPGGAAMVSGTVLPVAFGAVAVAVAPVAFGLAHPAAVAVEVALTAGCAALAVLARRPGVAAAFAVIAGAASVEAAAYGFGTRLTALTVLPILAAIAAVVALTGRVTALRRWGMGAAVLFLGLEAMTVGLAVGWSSRMSASLGFAVAGVLLVALAAWTARRTMARGPAEQPASRTAQSASPGERPVSPVEQSASPGERPASPGERPVSPGERPVSPGERPVSPVEQSASPGKPEISVETGSSVAQPSSPGGQPESLAGQPQGPAEHLAAVGARTHDLVRRLGYTGTALLLVATWLRLWAGEITTVEAYTAPLSVVLLAIGWWRSRGAEVSSWAAYGAGLSSTMVPSLVAVYAEEEWVRSLLLGLAALAVLLAGARARSQAPTVIGGLTLAGVALRELAPLVSELVLAVPRWVPIALGGLLLVLIGATYEARMRDLRRLRDIIARMR